jgi:hypothetical protein
MEMYPFNMVGIEKVRVAIKFSFIRNWLLYSRLKK